VVAVVYTGFLPVGSVLFAQTLRRRVVAGLVQTPAVVASIAPSWVVSSEFSAMDLCCWKGESGFALCGSGLLMGLSLFFFF